MSSKATFLAATFALAALAAPAQADRLVGLVDGRTLVSIDPATRMVSRPVAISGVGQLVGIDRRPADGLLYGLAADGSIVTIDPQTGRATVKSKLSETLRGGTSITVDFNPVADRLRVMTPDGVSLRVNVDDGKATVDGSHKFKEGDANATRTPRVVAGAYSNSVKGTTATALYDIDAGSNALVTQVPPNDGVLNTIGALGITLSGPAAFNIASMNGTNAAWLVTAGNVYSVDLQTGRATMSGALQGLTGALSHIAWVD
ncbi:DUF4394 domain-containing protein [Phreatobacter stygius]|uniref:DUF4394 domain-containing protein n=1 Tax=Phreatobacter stygius TaxID=1940610 RepID=A0A4D7ATA5_9HYPH|nr:DUF4394 domain-containing protein [Phreatobacter stygius]QCI62795.1 DUF4394 domain-containing protein [Phreatobacter stygius]